MYVSQGANQQSAGKTRKEPHMKGRERESGRGFLKRERECVKVRDRERGAKRKHRNGTLNRLSIRETN